MRTETSTATHAAEFWQDDMEQEQRAEDRRRWQDAYEAAELPQHLAEARELDRAERREQRAAEFEDMADAALAAY